MHSPCVIIGGGVAGLAAAIRLTELGIQPIVIEAGTYPSHKVCGEFFSPQALPLLRRWGIEPVLLPHMRLHTPTQKLSWQLPEAAGSLSHLTCDVLLMKKAQQGGAAIYTHMRVQDLKTSETGHSLILSNGETLTTPQLIVATGRLPGLRGALSPKFAYTGLKAHFKGIPLKDSLELFTFKGGYLGIAPIEGGKCNVACLMAGYRVKATPPVDLLLQHIFKAHPLLQDYFSQGMSSMASWMVVGAPSFGIKKTPSWPRTYFIGDAAATIPPATGNGLTMALVGGSIAAEYLMRNDAIGFQNFWRQCCCRPIFFGKLLHRAMLHPYIGNSCLRLASFYPALVDHIFKWTRLEE